MTFLSSKWLVGLVLAIGTLVLLAITGREEMHTEIVIDAPPEKVWEVLLDTESYPEWNPVFVKVEGKLEPDAKLINHVVQPGKDAVEMGSSVRKFEPFKELNQSGGIPGVITFDHRYVLKPENSRTRVIQHEVDQGLYMHFWDASWVEPAYARVNIALKKRVEELLKNEDPAL